MEIFQKIKERKYFLFILNKVFITICFYNLHILYLDRTKLHNHHNTVLEKLKLYIS